MSPRALVSRLPTSLKRRLALLPTRLGYRWGPRVMSELRKRWVILRHPGSEIRFEGQVRIGPGFNLHMPRGGTFIVGRNVEFRRNFLAEIGAAGRITIGEGAILGYDAILGCSTAIEIGKRCILGPGVYLSDGTHDYSADIKKAFLDRGYNFEVVRLGDDSAVAAKCTVTASIGERSMIAANSVVRKPVPPFYAAGGVPARLGRYFGPEDAEPEEGRRERLAWESERLSRVMDRAEPEDADRLA